MRNKYHEIAEELKMIFKNKATFELLAPSMIFLLFNLLFDFFFALATTLFLGLLLLIFNFRKKQNIFYAVLGYILSVILFLFIFLTQNEKAYFTPGIIISILTLTACIVSILFKRPLVAFTSHFARRWPLLWYWHEKVRPAYSEVTFFWAIYFLSKLAIQVSFFLNASTTTLIIVNQLLGWPSTVILLIFSYIYGAWRLKNLAGPSVSEFKNAKKPPWKSQERGF